MADTCVIEEMGCIILPISAPLYGVSGHRNGLTNAGGSAWNGL